MAELFTHNGRSGLTLGTYLTVPHRAIIETLAMAGLDFVRMDAFRPGWSQADLARSVTEARSVGLMPWARCQDEAQIELMIALGAEIVTVPSVGSPDQARRIVRTARDAAARRPKGGDVVVGCQIETTEGLAACREIADVDGIDVIHTGRNDLARVLGAAGGQFDPAVLDVERKIVETAWAAGKQVSLLFPVDERGHRLAAEWIERGVWIFALGTDVQVLQVAIGSEARSLREFASQAGNTG